MPLQRRANSKSGARQASSWVTIGLARPDQAMKKAPAEDRGK
jgi:hypothetical protein